MRRVSRGLAPSSLDGPSSAGWKEFEHAKVFFKNPANNKNKEFVFKAYKAQDIRDALIERFSGKCAYCEGEIAATQPIDVEHYRPKAGYYDGKKLIKPGYWWLAAVWTNLLPSCIDCNRARTQEMVGGSRKVKAGKANQFPLVHGSRRARVPGQERHEKPLLLDPCVDPPLQHLELLANGGIRPRQEKDGIESERGQATIEVLALGRRGLVDARLAVALKVQVAILHVKDTLADLHWLQTTASLKKTERAAQQAVLEKRLANNIAEMESYAAPGQRYTAVANELIQAFKITLGF